nr:unnamed protein product [Callosobruchus analis]
MCTGRTEIFLLSIKAAGVASFWR